MAATKKKSRGHVAIPFLLTLLISILAIGGVAIFIFQRYLTDQQEVKQMRTAVVKPTEEDNMTLLFVLDEPADPMPTTFMIARVLPEEKQMVFLCFPSNMLAVVDSNQDTLEGFYRNGGISTAKQAIENEAGIHTDRYIILNSESFQKICNIYAGVDYRVPSGVKGFTDMDKAQYLGPAQIEKLITYPFFDKGEVERCTMISDIMSEMINMVDDPERIVASMDTNFKVLVNMIDTDISSIDYDAEKDALKYMYRYGYKKGSANYGIATFRQVTGTLGSDDSDVFLLSDTFFNSVAQFFKTTRTD